MPAALPAVAPPTAIVRVQYSAARETAAAYQTRTPTIRELEQQATAAARRILPNPPATAQPVATLTNTPRTLQLIEAIPTATSTLAPTYLVATPTPDRQFARQAETLLLSLVEAQAFSGVVLVARNNQVLFQQTYGQADSEYSIGNTITTRFRLASLTKQFTAAAILLLAQEGQLQLSDAVCRYYQPCPPSWQPLTIRQLLNHTAGLPNYTDFADFSATEAAVASREDLIARFRDLPLNFVPDTAVSYSNANYVVLSAIIEAVSGQPYERFLTERILQPVQLSNTGYDNESGRSQQRATGYIAPNLRAPEHHMSTLDGAGALYSTAEDLLRWQTALYHGNLVREPFLREMLTPGLGGFGYGVKVWNMNDRQVIGHPGLVTGFNAFMAYVPNEDVHVIVLSNYQYAATDQIGFRLIQMLLDQVDR
jgi:CubicO group peptidase (beta-lactamase class C family)